MQTQHHAFGQNPWSETRKNRFGARPAEKNQVWWTVLSLTLVALLASGVPVLHAQTAPASPKEKDKEAADALEKVTSVYAQASSMHGKVTTTISIEKSGKARQIKGSGEFWCARPDKIRIAFGETKKRKQLLVCDGREYFCQDDEFKVTAKGTAPEGVLKLPWLDANRERYGEFWTALGLFYEPPKVDTPEKVELVPSRTQEEGSDLVGVQITLKNGARQRLWIDKKSGWLTEDELFVSLKRPAGQPEETLTIRQEYKMEEVGQERLPDETFEYQLPEGYRWGLQIIGVNARQYPKVELTFLGTLPKEDEKDLMVFYSRNRSTHMDKALAEITKANPPGQEFKQRFNLETVSGSRVVSSIGYAPVSLAGGKASASLSSGASQTASKTSTKGARMQFQVCEYKWPENTVRALSNVFVQVVQTGSVQPKKPKRQTTVRRQKAPRHSSRRKYPYRYRRFRR